MEIDQVRVLHGLGFGDHGGPVGRHRVVVELIIHADADFLQREVGIERLRAGKERGVFVAVIGEQIFRPRGPVRRNRHLDAGSRGPAQPPHERRLGVAGRDLGERLMIVGPGETAGRIEQPATGSITDAAPHRAGLQYRFGKTRGAKRRRHKCRTAANRDAERIYAGRQRWPGRERCINLATDENPVGQHIIVATLNPGEEAAAFVEGVECLKQIGRAVDAGTRRPIRASPRHAEVTADIKSGPVVGRRIAEGNRRSLRHHGVVGRGASGKHDGGGRGRQPKL